MGFKKSTETSPVKFSIDYEAHLLAWYRDNGLVEVVKMRLPELAYYEYRFGAIDMTGKRSSDLPDKSGYPENLQEWCRKEGLVVGNENSSEKLLRHQLGKEEGRRKEGMKYSYDRTLSGFPFGSHPADRDLCKKNGEEFSMRVRHKLGWAPIDPSIPVKYKRREKYEAGKPAMERFAIPQADEGSLARRYGITPNDNQQEEVVL